MVILAHANIRVFSAYRVAIHGKISQNCVHTWLVCKQLCMQPHTRFFKVYNDQKLFLMCRIVLEWRDREHGYVEEAIRGYLMTQQALHACGLYKFW